jgi:hypothetical protein
MRGWTGCGSEIIRGGRSDEHNEDGSWRWQWGWGASWPTAMSRRLIFGSFEMVVRWERLRRQNHWFHALYNACCAGHLAAVRLAVQGHHGLDVRLAGSEILPDVVNANDSMGT